MSHPVRPLLFVPRYWPGMGGAELHSRRLAQELALQVPIEVARCCDEEARPTDLAFAYAEPRCVRDDDMLVHTIAPANSWKGGIRLLAEASKRSRIARGVYGHLARRLARSSFQNIADGATVAHAIYNGFTPGAQALQALGKPFVWTPLAHTTKPTGTAWSSPQFRALYRKADALIAMTDFEREWLIGQGASPSRVHVCPMAPLFAEDVPEPQLFRENHALGEDPFILFLGRTAQYKGYGTVLEATPRIWEQHPTARFVFAGPVTSEASALFSQHQDPRILVTGPLTDADKKSALAACSLVCVPSTEESLGVVYLEGWSFEKPVIAADIPALQSVIESGKDGLLIEPSTLAVANAVAELLGRPSWAAELGKNGARKVERQYNWASIADAHLKIYQSVI
ncbi:glycosyltransferase family 4 protein [Maricaulis sp.]|uniref:glycosyltransferase family 4 protein n=1 Tax=Maricaulis sp. TaxID=1486257 RepID=UPI001B1AE50B|nr:glycosyltransferase family 4 protein [Maricaulis sp.]MBO6798549.1 glycosyltransferase family 4 protein [Maricaulis sp.]